MWQYGITLDSKWRTQHLGEKDYLVKDVFMCLSYSVSNLHFALSPVDRKAPLGQKIDLVTKMEQGIDRLFIIMEYTIN